MISNMQKIHLHDNFQVHPMPNRILLDNTNIRQTTIQILASSPSYFGYPELIKKYMPVNNFLIFFVKQFASGL